jgi:Na+-translocating ferredoxin:NAD+ oxidoreductase RnfD subunit
MKPLKERKGEILIGAVIGIWVWLIRKWIG